MELILGEFAVNAQARRLQENLLERAHGKFDAHVPLTAEIEHAFYSTPRHLFVDRFREAGATRWVTLNSENRLAYLSTLYHDSPLVIFGEREDFLSDGGAPVSTISQPSFVLFLLALLALRPGERVFELGTGSGWNAALMSRLVGPEGLVVSVEIIPELAQQARARLRRLNCQNVTVIEGDATEALAGEKFDKGIFTAGASDLSLPLFDEVKIGGHLIFVLKRWLSSDLLMLLRRTSEGFVSERMVECGFVSVTHKKAAKSSLGPQSLTDILVNMNEPVSHQDIFIADEAIDFLSLNTHFIALRSPSRGGFAWKVGGSIGVVEESRLTSYGNEGAREDLLAEVQRWEAWGAPAVKDLNLKILPRDGQVRSTERQFVCERQDSLFIWSP